jgi:hypothetical protein
LERSSALKSKVPTPIVWSIFRIAVSVYQEEETEESGETDETEEPFLLGLFGLVGFFGFLSDPSANP